MMYKLNRPAVTARRLSLSLKEMFVNRTLPGRLARAGSVLSLSLLAFTGFLALGDVTTSAQDRLKTMPGYAQFQKVSPQLNGAVRSGAINGTWSADSSSVEYVLDGKRYRFDVATRSAAELGAVAYAAGAGRGGRGGGRGGTGIERGRQAATAEAPDGKLKAFYRDRNLWVSETAGANESPITTDGNDKDRIKYGTASWVYGEELAQTSAIWWSPDSRKVAYYRFDEKQVIDYNLQLDQTKVQSVNDVEIDQMSNAVGYAVGPLIGGILIDSLGWRATFLFRVLPALFLAWLTAVKLASLGERKHTRRFDFFSALTLAGGIAAGLLTLSQSRALGWSSPQVVILAAATIACFAGFVVVKARAKSPMVELTVIRLAPFIIANVLSVMTNCARFAVGLLLPFYVINVLKYPAATGGTLMLATYLLTIVAAPLAGKLSERIGTARLSSSGLAVQGLGLWMLSRLNGQTDYLSLAFTLGFVGLGLGIFEAPNMNFIMGAIPRTQQGVAGSIANMMRPIGIVLGATGWSLLFDQRQQSYAPAAAMASSQAATGMLPALQDVFLSAAGLCFVACVLSLFRNGETSESNVRAES
jgi:MFS family permease